MTGIRSSFTCKGLPVDVRQIGRDLKVGYVLQVSVRKAENRVRVATQLVVARTGNHIWAQRYDRELNDVFAVQDEIAAKIAASVEPHIYAAEVHDFRPERILRRVDPTLWGRSSLFAASAARLALEDAKGHRAVIVTSDGDLQNDPADIPALVNMLESGYDIVCGWRKHRKDAFFSRLLPSRIANRLISWREPRPVCPWGVWRCPTSTAVPSCSFSPMRRSSSPLRC